MLTIFTRSLTVVVFLRNGERYGGVWRGAAIWEAAGVGATAGAMMVGRWV